MAESVLKTLDDVMFIQGETPVNQENWQKYFGGALPNGIYEGFAPTSWRETPVSGITGGTIVVNGLVYKMANAVTVDSEIPESEGYRLISLRIYYDTGVAKIVETRGDAPVASDATILNGIIQATQNPVVSGEDFDHNAYTDYRLLYQGHRNSLYKAGVDLRQAVMMRRGRIPTSWNNYWTNYYKSLGYVMLSGDQIVNVTYSGNWSLHVWFDPMNPPDNARVTTNANYVYFHEYPAILDVKRLGSSADSPEELDGIKDEFRNVIDCFGTNWDRQTITNPRQIYNPPVVWRYHDATTDTPFVIQYRGKNGNNQNMFLIQMPTTGAPTEWGLVEGTLSNQQDLQDALDAKADATAVYSKTEADTRMYSKAETDALLDAKVNATDVYTKTETGEIISDYYTKQESDALLDAKADSADVYDKTETYTKAEADALLDAKANASDVYKKANTYSKSEVDTALGDKANVSDVYTKSQADTLLSNKENKSALGTLAYQNSLSYSSLVDKPTFGPLATNDNVVLSANYVTGVLPVAKGGTGRSSAPMLWVQLDRVGADSIFAQDGIGVQGILSATHGGTGTSSLDTLYENTYNAKVASVTYYVSTDGNDSNSGTDNTAPLRTIAKAIEKIGYRVRATIELLDEDATYYEDTLLFNKASSYLLVTSNNRIIPNSIHVMRSSLDIFGSVRISTVLNVQNGAKVISDISGSNYPTITFDDGIFVSRSACFFENVVSNSSNNAFYVDGGIVTYKSLTGSYANLGVATNGGIISTGDGHIFS